MFDDAQLPLVFLGLMAFSVLVYAILDGFDLGVGILLPMDNKQQRDRMVASIGPFWDANETWLVLAVGILLIAFPQAHSLILRELYIPAAFMLIGLIVRGVSFDFRVKAVTRFQRSWDWAFKLGSLFVALSQGYMLGRYVLGFDPQPVAYGFAVLSAMGVAAAYTYIGGAWLVMKTTGPLQLRASIWTRRAGWVAAVGIALVSIANVSLSPDVAARWLTMPNAILLFPLPVLSGAIVIFVDYYLRNQPHAEDFGHSLPFFSIAVLFSLSFIGLGYSYFPYVVPHVLLATEGASAPVSLRFILTGIIIIMPTILLYTAFTYRVFWGKATDLTYH